jgi:uracil phosphoribosyltransferase
MTNHGLPNLIVVDHPLVQHKLTRLRDRETGTRDFKALVSETSMLLAYEATKDLPLESIEVEGPLEWSPGKRLAGKKLALVAILRAGLGMVDGITQMVPHARVGHIGVSLDEETREPVDYYFKIPGSEEDRLFLVLDPMLATGGSVVQAMRALKDAGATRIRLLCLVAAPDGVRRMLEDHPDVPIYTAALDRELDAQGLVRPGLGDAGDRLFGTQ